MSSSFDRWEKDPFFFAAEEVQESADRMESLYRRWMHEMKDRPRRAREEEDVASEIRRELQTALGTAKWQLEEFNLASRSSDDVFPAKDDARLRHTQFVSAIGNQILTVESSLRESELEEGEGGLSWVRLNEGERDELAAFLSGSPLPPEGDIVPVVALDDGQKEWGHSESLAGEPMVDCLKKPPLPVDLTPQGAKEKRIHAHRRSASAGNDIGLWTISLSNDHSPRRSVDDRSNMHLPKVLSLSGLAVVMESTSKMKWPKNGFSKWKCADELQDSEAIPLQNHHMSRGPNSCYDRSKSYLSSCSIESYNKQFYGWIGSIQRQLQRSQYQIQYGRPLHLIFWVVATLLLIVLFVLRAILGG